MGAAMSTRVIHGGRDAGPVPRVDASTNANPLGPSPIAQQAVAAAELGPYPDPEYLDVRVTLAGAAGVSDDEVVVGAGATELIHRLVRVVGGPVLVEAATFGEYTAAADAAGVPVHHAEDAATFLAALDGAAIAFVASPGNPDGRVRSAAWCEQVGARARATGTVVVLDLAYAPYLDIEVPVPPGAIRLHAPNKIHGCTGLRAGWLTAPAPLAERLRDAAVSWLVSTPGTAFLAATTTPEAARWIAACRPQLTAWRDELAAGLTDLGLTPEPGDAPFVVVPVPDAETAAQRLRDRHGVKVRVATSLGRPGAWRIAAQPPQAQRLLLDAIAEVLGEPAGMTGDGTDVLGGGVEVRPDREGAP